MGKMCYSKSKDTVYHIGGINSEGVDYSLELGQTKWSELENNHSLLLNARGLELTYNSAIYFK